MTGKSVAETCGGNTGEKNIFAGIIYPREENRF